MLIPINRPAGNQYPSHDGAGPHSNRTSTIEHGLESITNLSVKYLAKQLINSQFTGKWEMEQDNAFAICDLGDVYRQYLKWVRHLPRVKPFYGKKKSKCNSGDLKNLFFGIISTATKAFPDPKVIRLLASLGVGFDCASKMEIQKVLLVGADPSQIIYANPCKQASHIHYSAQKKVYKMTFDNSDELYKIKSFHPHAKLVIRILPNDHSNQKGQLGAKYGATLAAVPRLLCLAKKLSLDVIGASFHIGITSKGVQDFIVALSRARAVFDLAESAGYHFSLLDIGGGFYGGHVVQDGLKFEDTAAALGSAIDKYFPENIEVISEPGKFFVDSSVTCFTRIIGRRVIEYDNREPSYMYYLNDGIFGSFMTTIFSVKKVTPSILVKSGVYHYGEDIEGPLFDCSIWGPTCAHDDCIQESAQLPVLHEGDWLYWSNFGAYTNSVASEFNGFSKPKILYTNTFSLHPIIALS